MATLMNYDISVLRYSSHRNNAIWIDEGDNATPIQTVLSRRPNMTMFFLECIAHYHFLVDATTVKPKRSCFEGCEVDVVSSTGTA